MEFSYQNEYSLLCSTLPQKTVDFKVFDDLPLCDDQLNKKRKKTEKIWQTHSYTKWKVKSLDRLCEVTTSSFLHTQQLNHELLSGLACTSRDNLFHSPWYTVLRTSLFSKVAKILLTQTHCIYCWSKRGLIYRSGDRRNVWRALTLERTQMWAMWCASRKSR